MHRTDGEGWAWPGGVIEEGESPEQAAWREVWEECGYRLGSVGVELMRSTKNGVDFTTFVCPVEDEFVPRMNHEHDSFMWADPEAALAQAKAAGSPLAVADDADLEGPEIPQPLFPVSDQNEPEDDLDDETADLILAALEELEERLGLVEDCMADSLSPHLAGDEEGLAYVSSNEPIQGGESHAELEAALTEGPLERDDRKAARQLGTRFRSV